tara:strand:- start:3981 stop:5003 length:1023 start_codon:yes stop_codon:yes gene_type:complete
MIYLQIILSASIYLLIIYFFNKTEIFNKNRFPHQNFVSKNPVLPIGGYFIVILYLVINFKNFNLSFIYLFSIFLIGALSDLKKFNSPKYRFIAQSIIVVLFIIHFDVKIVSTRIDLFDQIIENHFFSVIFVSFCFLILINGTNFIDGLNGLVLFYYLFIVVILNFSGPNLILYKNDLFFNNVLIILSFLLILNVLNKIYLGDGGSYLIGFLFAYYLIGIYEKNPSVSPFYIILLLWYPCFENLFSILRKFKFKKSAAEADTKHFHQLLFYFFSKNINIKNKLIINNFTSIIINLFNLIIFFIGTKFITKTNIQIFLIFSNLMIYLYVYYMLFKYRYKKIK